MHRSRVCEDMRAVMNDWKLKELFEPWSLSELCNSVAFLFMRRWNVYSCLITFYERSNLKEVWVNFELPFVIFVFGKCNSYFSPNKTKNNLSSSYNSNILFFYFYYLYFLFVYHPLTFWGFCDRSDEAVWRRKRFPLIILRHSLKIYICPQN